MTRPILGVPLALALALVLALTASLLPTTASAGGAWEVTANGGLGLPMGEFADKDKYDARSGSQFGIEISRDIGGAIAIGVDGSWNRNKHGAEGTVEPLPGGATLTVDKYRFQSQHLGIHGKYKFPMSGPLKVHALLGLGFLDVKLDYEEVLNDAGTRTVLTDESQNVKQPGTRWGGKAGLGAMYMVSPTVGLGVGVDYNQFVMDEKNFGIKSVQYVGVCGRLTYHFMAE